MRELMLAEEFKNCIPMAVSTYLIERHVNTLHEAAVLADKFALTHCVLFKKRHKSDSSQSNHTDKSNHFSSNSEPICY